MITRNDIIKAAKEQCSDIEQFESAQTDIIGRNRGYEHIVNRHVSNSPSTCIKRLLQTMRNGSDQVIGFPRSAIINGEIGIPMFSKFNTGNPEKILPLIRDSIIEYADSVEKDLNKNDISDINVEFNKPIGSAFVRISENKIKEFSCSALYIKLAPPTHSVISPYDIITAYPILSYDEIDDVTLAIEEEPISKNLDNKFDISYLRNKNEIPDIATDTKLINMTSPELKELYAPALESFILDCNEFLTDEKINEFDDKNVDDDLEL